MSRLRNSADRRLPLKLSCLLVLAFCPNLAGQEVRHSLDTLDSFQKVMLIQDLGGKGDIPGLIQLLEKDESKLVRAAAAIMLASFQEETAVGALIRAMQDPEDWVRKGSLAALSYIGGELAEAPIRAALQDEDAQVVEAVPGALARLTPGTPVAFSTLAQGADGGAPEPTLKRIDSQQGLQQLWTQHRPSADPPEVDFSRERVLAVFLGSRTDEGAFIRVAGVEKRSDYLRVLIEQSPPMEMPAAGPASFSPFHIVRIENAALPVHMLRRFVSGQE